MSTPMALDSPGNGLLGKTNGASNQPSTAKIQDMIALYRPTKVSFVLDTSTITKIIIKHFKHLPSGSGPGKPTLPANTILSLDFDDEGGQLLTSESDNSMQVYNIKEGKHYKSHLSQKYGVSHAMFGHAPGCIIHASTKVNRKLSHPGSEVISY